MTTFAFIQQGGASNEYYLWLHDTRESAEQHVESCEEATYNTTDVYEVRDDTDFDALRDRVENDLGRDDWDGADRLLRQPWVDPTYSAEVWKSADVDDAPLWESEEFSMKRQADARQAAIDSAIEHVRSWKGAAAANYALEDLDEVVRVSIPDTGEHVADIVPQRRG
jgi:hypothetical protein